MRVPRTASHRSSPPVPLAPSRRELAAALLPRPRPAGLPERVVEASGVRTDRAHLDAWARVSTPRPGVPLPTSLPAAYLHVLAGGASMRLLLDPAFPLPLLGLVHVGQRLELRREVDPREPLDLAVRAQDLRPHRRGRQLDVVASASVAGEEVWRGVSTYLHREGSSSGGSGELPGGSGGSGGSGEPRRELPAGSVRWVVPTSTGRAYARVSGDPNPIHLSRPTARLLGFRRPIAHGMWTLARALGDLEGRLPAAHVVSARFLRPLAMPGHAVCGWGPLEGAPDGSLLLAVRRERDGEPHLVAEVTPAT
ncbi:MaoC family dehydratase [Pseudokineococcus sp. 1T1Z-3]|uniref:MaoC family dehydratase n=1 Tax=Pseudokineococcus sp. 1T1Z-3 TaxID=3132745 RepID=UPI0030B698E7